MKKEFVDFDPNMWGSYRDYLSHASSKGDEGKRNVALLRHVFTPLAYGLGELVREDLRSGISHSLLIGSDPELRRYYHHNLELSLLGLPGCVPYDTHVQTSIIPTNQADRFTLYILVGEYGQKIAFATANAVRALDEKVIYALRDDCERTNELFSELLEKETYRESTTLTLLDGIAALASVYAFLISHRVAQYDDPIELYADLVRDGVFEHLSLRLDNGNTTHLSQGGYHFFESPLRVHSKDGIGTIDFSENFSHFLRVMKQRGIRSGTFPKYRKLGCPVGHGNVPGENGEVFEASGIHQVAKALHPYLEYFYNQQ